MYNLLAIDIVYVLAKKRAEGEGAKSTEIAKTLGVSRTTVHRYLRSMLDEDIINQRGHYYYLDASGPLVQAFCDAREQFERLYKSHAEL